MPRLILILLLLAATALAFTQDSQAPRHSIPADDLNNLDVIGSLGLPLGTAVEIEAVIVHGSELDLKALSNAYVLRVTKVAGKPLPKPPLLEFAAHGIKDVKLPNDPFELYEHKHGKRTGRLDDQQVAQIEKDYVGRRVKLLAYETGGFRGAPRSLPPDYPVWADYSYAFATELLVLDELK